MKNKENDANENYKMYQCADCGKYIETVTNYDGFCNECETYILSQCG